MTSEELAWFAGVLESEGCFTQNRGGQAQIRVQMTDKDVIERLHALAECGHMRPLQRQRQAHHKQAWELQISRRDDAMRLMRAIRPWMGERRGQKIDEVLAAQTIRRRAAAL
jgi:hypothetical protein